MWIKNIGTTTINLFLNGFTGTQYVEPGDSKRIVKSGTARTAYDYIQSMIRSTTADIGKPIDAIIWREKLEKSDKVTPWSPAIEDEGYQTWLAEQRQRETWQDGWVEFPLGIFLLSSPTKSDSNGYVVRDVEAYDGLIILDQDKFIDRTNFPAGMLYEDAIEDILKGAGINKINIELPEGETLSNDKEYTTGESKLTAINDLLGNVNNTPMWVDSGGYFRSSRYERPDDKSASYTYSDQDFSITVEGLEEEQDLFDISNSWVVVVSNPESEPLTARKDNLNINSPTSVPSRGRRIVDFRELNDIASKDTLNAYVDRIASEASQVYGRIRFSTPIMPMHEYYDVLGLNYAPLDIDGKFAEASWSFKLEVGSKMTHEVRKVVSID